MSTYDRLIQIIQQRFQKEDAVPANAAGGGNVAGIGVGAQGEPPGQQALMKKLNMMKRKAPNVNVDS